MANSTRMSSFMPTIKCSMCAREIEISMMGDHVCGGPPEPTPPLDSYDDFDNRSYNPPPQNGPSLLKPGRMAPPSLDTSAANRPFLRQDQLTPISLSSGSRSVSPRTPNDGRKSPFGRSQRGQPPSPEILSSNIDNAFPPFPVKGSPRDASRNLYVGRNEQKYAEADPMYAPVSPRITGGGDVLQRMNSIAPGPFDVNSRRPAARPAQDRRPQTAEKEAAPYGHRQQPSAVSGHSRSSTTSSLGGRGLPGSIRAPKVERDGGYGGFGRPTGAEDIAPREPMRSENRSQTFPREQDSNGAALLPRRPSEPGNSARYGRPSNSVSENPYGTGRGSAARQRRPSQPSIDRSRPAAPDPSTMADRRDVSRQSTGYSGNSNLGDEFGIGNPYHTPNLSQSSSSSGQSVPGLDSSRSSPSSNVGSLRRKPSDTSNIDHLMRDIQATMEISPQKPLPRGPPIREQFARPLPPRVVSKNMSPESPMDPAIQDGRLSPLPPNYNKDVGPRQPEPAAPRRPSTAKGNCKGCGEAIVGKSVSSADGRLTGRYHKACFVCKTCSAPFATATFYVHADAPYCERHYHQHNNSVCVSCDRGIEGPYLETERKTKHHPNCLTCTDCRRVLRDDYFEMNGRVFCERDAFRRAQQRSFLGTGGTSRMERRTTRMMMI